MSTGHAEVVYGHTYRIDKKALLQKIANHAGILNLWPLDYRSFND